jgi:hypothetical protein
MMIEEHIAKLGRIGKAGFDYCFFVLNYCLSVCTIVFGFVLLFEAFLYGVDSQRLMRVSEIVFRFGLSAGFAKKN